MSHKLTTNVLRSKWDKNVTNLCSFCKLEPETVTHVLAECTVVRKTIWHPLCRWIKYFLQLKEEIYQDTGEIIFSNYTGQFQDQINIIGIITKQYVYATKCIGEKLRFNQLIVKIREHLITEKIMYLKQGQTAKYYRKYGKLIKEMEI